MTTVEMTAAANGAEWSVPRLDGAFASMRAADLRDGPATRALRADRLDRLALAILEYTDELVAAVDADFGGRAPAATKTGEIATSIQAIVEARRNLRNWMKPRHPAPGYFRLGGVQSRVEPHPLGVVGVIAPWNFPIALAIQPVAAALAAGNRVLIKPSEVTSRTSGVMATALGKHFSPEELLVVTGDVDTAVAFSRLPFDHLLFTGASSVGRQIAMVAAEKLVPVTLELGGKNPVVVGLDADLKAAATRIATARLANSGQLCLSPDYVMVPRTHLNRFADLLIEAFRRRVPSPDSDPEYCAIINERHFSRIKSLIDEAEARGARVLRSADEAAVKRAEANRRIVPTVVTGVSDDMELTHEEVFGPVLTLVPFDDIETVIDYVNARPTPLASYWFGGNSAMFRNFKDRTRSGGVTRNDFALHAALEGLPFGGVGNSGTGYYHGRFGFDTFSHLRAVASSPRLFSPVAILSPPFSPKLGRFLDLGLTKYRNRVARRVSKGRRREGPS